MNAFARQKEKRNNIDFFTGNALKFLVKVDEKGRILIPSDIRKIIGINFNDEIVLESSIRKNYFVLYKNNFNISNVTLKKKSDKKWKIINQKNKELNQG